MSSGVYVGVEGTFFMTTGLEVLDQGVLEESVEGFSATIEEGEHLRIQMEVNEPGEYRLELVTQRGETLWITSKDVKEAWNVRVEFFESFSLMKNGKYRIVVTRDGKTVTFLSIKKSKVLA